LNFGIAWANTKPALIVAISLNLFLLVWQYRVFWVRHNSSFHFAT